MLRSWQESLAYTQLSSRAQDEHEDTSTRTDISTDTSTGTGTSATLSGDWEMTRLLDSILGLDKQDTMNYTGQRKEVQIGALQSDRPRWGQTISWGRTESQSFMKEISPQKAESSPVSQSTGDGWAKHQTESSYFSLERRKSDPTWVSSPPRASSSTLPTRSDPVRTGRHLTSSISSLDSDLPGCTRGGGEGRHALVRQEYTVLADLPKPKRISHREAFEQERSSSRTRSPGRAEVERIFGYERRKSETLEAFQALEDGLLDRLDGKTPLLAKEGQLGRRQSSPTLYREGNKRLLQQLEQPGRRGGEALHSVSPARRSERDWRSQVDSMCHMSTDKCMDRERVSPQPLNPGKHTDSNWKSQRDSLHPTNPGKSSDNSWTSRGGHLRSLSPGKHPESNWKSPKETHPVSPVTSTERKWKGAKEPLHPMSAGKRMSARHSLEEKPHLVSPGKCTERDQKGQGKSLRPVSPARKLESDWRSQAETLRSRSPTRQPERDWRSQAETLRSRSPTGRPERDWRGHAETLRSRSPTRQPEKDWRSHAETLRSRRPIGRPERDWRSHAETLRSRSPTGRPERDWRSQVETLRSRSPARQLKRDWRSQEEALCSRSQTQRSEDHWKTQEKCLCHMNPMQQLERDWRSQGECLYSVSSGHQPETKSPVSPSQWLESDMKSHEQSLDLSSEKQLENDRGKEETLLHQSQLDRGTTRPLNSASSMGSQDLYLNTNGQRHKPDLLNFKKGWMSILDELGEWKKHWFVLTDSSLRYYRDSNAEEADELDGEIDLRSCTEVTEYAVQRNYGFQIHTKDATFTLSAMTSGIRRNWIEALRKNVRPASAPDVTKLSDCNKENSFRSCVPQKGSLRSEEQWPGLGSEVISKGSNRKVDGPRHTFDYVELAPLQQGPLNQGAPQRTRGSWRGISDRVTKHEDLERDLALRSEERRKWFEAPDTGVLQGDSPAGALCWKACEQELLGPALSEDQRSRLSEEIEKKWLELERMPLKESKRLPLTALLNQSKGGFGDSREALEKEVQSLRAQLESWRVRGENLRDTGKSYGDGHMPQGFISQEACERSLAEMESLHQQVMTELQRHHQRELERLRQEKERLLAEEAAATAAAIEALKKVHKEELNRELGRTRSFQQSGSGSEALRRQHQLDVDSLKRELQVLSERYSQKCLEIGDLTEKAEEREQMLQRCQQEGKELLRQNQELQTCLSEEIQRLRTFITSQGTGDGALHNGERSSCELEVLLRVKENELQYLKKEVQCLKDELQMMQKDKRFASGKYQDVYVELNHIKLRSEREIEQLKEHLRLAMAALQEKETLRNSISE
ncbi:TRIO and F-actin-binding protein isoform X3 [Mauremys mutica]|uniref:TRIO and F-actin-binding protein isoform X3 n=1 Tax=Mauremys mutica TaxID=74926 RepID=UPI001D15D0B5|nr:TRIO and F-actin-binding protein isoform X3 [Mauremys mutica]